MEWKEGKDGSQNNISIPAIPSLSSFPSVELYALPLWQIGIIITHK